MSQFKTFKNNYFSQIYIVSALYLFKVSHNRPDEGLTLETSGFLLFSVANLHFQLSC